MALPAGSIAGRIQGGGTSANFAATVDCPEPQGGVSGEIKTNIEGTTVTYTFDADFIDSIVVRRTTNLRFVSALFLNGQISDGVNNINDASILVSGTLQTDNTWSGSLSVVSPSLPAALHVAGTWRGNVEANRSVVCKVAF